MQAATNANAPTLVQVVKLEPSTLCRIRCTRCGWYIGSYTAKELIFFIQFHSPQPFWELIVCRACSAVVYRTISENSVQDERAELINNPMYWGVLDYYTASVLRADLYSAGRGGTFIWEYRIPTPEVTEYYVPVVCVTSVKHRHPSNLRLSKKLVEGVDSYTTYIARSVVNRKYYHTYGIKQFDDCKTICDYLDWNSPRETLSQALEVVKQDRSTVCSCPSKRRSRFSMKHEQTRKVKNTVWSLEKLCAFFIRNYAYQYQKELCHMTHVICRNVIRDLRVEKSFR